MAEAVTRSDGYLAHVPNWHDDGFDFETGRPSMRLELEFGRWQEGDEEPGPEGDADLEVLRTIHGKAVETYAEVMQTLRQIHHDDDPSLNAAGRLKIAAKLVEPKLTSLAEMAGREVERVVGEIEREEAEITQASRHLDAASAVNIRDIRFYFRGLDPAARVSRALMAVHDRDRETLQALASGPAYLSDLTESMHAQVVAAYRARVAPERAARVAALRRGMTRAARALSVLEAKTRKCIDFDKARALIAREASRNAPKEGV